MTSFFFFFLVQCLCRRGSSISLWDTAFGANTERFQGFLPLLPHLCPLSVPKGGGMWGIFGKPFKRAILNSRVCVLY